MQLAGNPHQEFDAGTMLLENFGEVMNEFTIINESTVGRLVRALASRSVFGNDVLRQSPFSGDYI